MSNKTLRRGSILAAGLVAVLVAAPALDAGVFRSEPYPSWDDDGVSQTLNLFTFYEEHEGLRVFAGAEISRFHADATFFPMQIAVGNGNDKPVTISLEEFVLTDDQGIYYPTAIHSEIASEYRKSSFDQNLLTRSEFLGSKFVGFTQIASLFYPNISFRGVKNDRVQLPKGTFLSDVIYFRKPEGPLNGRIFTLTVYFPEQERQMDVKFRILGKKN